jgi:TP901 family phage tail tape measure protein
VADVNANIGVNIDTSDALAQLKNLQRQISQFHSSVAKSSETAGVAQRNLQKNFLNSVNAIEGFSAELKTVRTTAESFSNSLEKNKLSMREYFRFAASQSKTFGKNFGAEFSVIEKTAIERVKTLQTQYIKMGRDASGAMQAIAIRPTVLNMKDLGTQTAIAAQKQVIFNQLVKQGSTNLLNFGKNTQWAGRQLMVGFTLPLATLGLTAGRVFMDMEKAAIKFKKVYGDLFTAPGESEAAMESIVELGKQYTAYGVAVSDALSMAADAAAAGFAGADLQNQTAAALKLSVLGQLELNKALETTISLQNAFGISSKDLATEIDFLNAVENQTVISLDDMTTAVPKVAPVIQSLGGDVRDLAFFMAAMKEGGINASEGANALKSGLASLINPTQRARDMLTGFGVNLREIIDQNEGDVSGVVVDFARALDDLDPLNRAQAIEQMFGKFQFARLSTLFANVAKDGTQAARVLDLAGASVEELAALSEGELGVAAASSMNKFLAAVENIKLALAPIGETFLQIATPIIEFGTKMLEAFNNLPDGIKKAVTAVITIIGGIGPIALMTFGLINNGIANMIKFFATVRLGYLRITGQAKGVGDETQYMTTEQLEAAAAAASLDQAHSNLTQRFTAEKVAVDALRASYEAAVAAGNRFALLNPGMMKPGAKAASSAPRLAKGGILSGPGNGKSDSILSWLSNGEAVIPAEVVKENPELIKALIAGGIKIPGFAEGGVAGGAGARKSGKLMVLPGGAEFAHFSEAIEMTGRDLLALAEASGSTQRQMEKLRSMVGDGLDKTFKTFDSSVERLSGELNQLVGEAGSGKSVPKALAERDLVERGRDARSPIMNKMMKDGVSPEDALAKADKITEEVKTRFDLLGDDIQVTAEMINKITKEAYEAVAAIDEDVAKAYAEMQKVRTVKDESGARGAKGDRFAFGKGSYKSEAETIKRVPDKAGFETSYNASGFKTTEEMAKIAELTEVEVQQMFKNLPEQVKLAVYDQLKLGTKQFITALLDASEAGVVDGIKSSTQQASPSKKARTAGENIGKGAIDGIESQIDEAKTAGNQVGTAAVAGVQQTSSMPVASAPRRADSGGVAVWDSQAKQYQTQAKMAEINASRQAGFARATQASINKVQDFSKKLSGAGIGITSVAGIFTMFGGKVGEVAGIIMQVAGLFTTLAFVTSQLITAKRAEAAMSMVTSIRTGKLPDGTMAATKGFMGGAKGMAGIKNLFGNVGKVAKEFLPILGKIPKGAGKLTLALVALAAVFSIGKVVFENLMKPFRLLGETANLSADKLKTLGDILGVEIKKADFSSKFTGSTAKTSEEKAQVEVLLESEEFQTEFADQIEGIKNATKEDAQRSLNALALQLSAGGLDTAAVEAVINAIVIEAGKKDLNLEFASIDFKSKDGLASITRLAQESSAKLAQSFASQDTGDALLGWLGGGQLKAQVQTTAGEFASLFESLQIGFSTGDISAEDFTTQINSLSSEINSMDPSMAQQVVDVLSQKIGIEDDVKAIDNFNDKLLVINATAAGIEIPENVVKALGRASKAGASKKDLQTAARLRKEINGLIVEETKALEDAREAEEEKARTTAAVTEAKEGIGKEIETLQNEATAYQILTEAGWDSASAMSAVSDAAIAQGLAMAATADERQSIINDLSQLMQMRRDADARRGDTGGGGGGGGASKSAMQEALESLGKQRTEIKNNIAAYGGLRKAGFSAAEAATVAGDATLAAALASTQVGSAKWKELVNQIRLVRVEALKTSEGLREAFDGLKNRADEYYSILEQQVERKYADGLKAAEKQAKALNRAIEELNDVSEDYQDQVDDMQRDIEIQFDRPIEALNEETSDLSNDLSLMDREADKITKRYDEQAQALDRVNKINQRIIAQQKQQVSLSSALVEGDIAAAASAVQDIRATNADAAGQSQGEMLDVAKQAELDALRSASGMSRVEIEQRQFEISQEIYELEEQREDKLAEIQVIEDKIYDIQRNQIKPLEDQLELNEDIVQSIEDQRDAELEVIEAQKQKWEDAQQALNLSKIKAGEFNDVIAMAKGLTADVVTNWEALEDQTRTLTIKTVMAGIGGEPTDAAIVQESGGGGGGSSTPASTPGGEEPAVDPNTVTAGERPETSPFGWLGDPMEQATNWWDAIVAWFQNLPTMIGDAAGNLWAGIQSIPAWLGEQWTNFQTWLSELPYNAGVAAGNLWNGIKSIGAWLGEQWTNFKTWFTEDLPNGIKQWGRDTWRGIQNIGVWLGEQWENFKAWVISIPGRIAAWAKDLWNNGLPSFGKWIGEKTTELFNWIKSLPSKIADWAGNLWNGFWAGLADGWNDFLAGFSSTQNEATGGMIRNQNSGGMIYRNAGGDVPGQGNTDTVSAMLTPGEYVVNKRATAKFRPVLKAINSGTFGGGLDAGRYKTRAPRMPRILPDEDMMHIGGTPGFYGPGGPGRYETKPPKYSPSNFSKKVYNIPDRMQGTPGNVSMFAPQSTTATQMDNPVYNYSLSVNVNGSGANADDIANTVMTKIKRMDSQRLRKQVVN